MLGSVNNAVYWYWYLQSPNSYFPLIVVCGGVGAVAEAKVGAGAGAGAGPVAGVESET